ncbi:MULTISPECIES: GIN domain-containing protein [unclassified Sphingomonas]|uniref:GIN domain-containing protein n=1 Tax=unclassified Sphingomonas TaxID=196159 RepID=UPI0006FB4D6D|nr:MULTISPECIES: DUF2807 domain-containing protein [unclassified Sphingomonas]KQM62054.1 hypothetical protein ASE65_03245 [Sphingomonas sp. Leaf16]KQN13455.1 hypothetical protein ASE81_03315 [Sphingomonas sp. Leaf29]KQN23310.1 hypothetical protein ASE83_02095 [Sphingomonas sp. Leaf32]
MIAPLLVAVLLAPAAAAPVPPPQDAERRLMLTGFDRVQVDGPFTVRVSAGTAIGGRIVGAPRALDAVDVRVEGQTLIVAPARDDGGRPDAASAEPLVVELTNDRLAGVAVRGPAKVRVERMAGAQLDLSLTGDGSIEVGTIDAGRIDAMLIGSGRLTLAGHGGEAQFLVNGPGTIDAGGLSIDALLVQSQGTGTGRYRARYTADINAQGSGMVTVDGTPRCRTQGSATIRCG